jgi:hypothetical protein
MISYGLIDILRDRTSQASFHVASEKSIRIEYMRFFKDQVLGPLRFKGDVIVTCLEGNFVVGDEGILANALTQVVIPEGESLNIRCTSEEGAVQLIWAPPFASAFLAAFKTIDSNI